MTRKETSATSPPLRVFVGDVQGCADELEDLLRVLDEEAGRHELWFVGDLVNRGPASARVLRRLIELGADSVLGNHDLHLLLTANGKRSLAPGDTLQDVLEAPDRDALLGWLRMRPLVREWDDLVLVHAGLHPDWQSPRVVAAPLEAAIARGEVPWRDRDLRFLTRARYCDSTGALPPKHANPCAPPYAPWDHHYRGERTVVCGHWAARGLVRGERVRRLDSGCVWGGRLSAWIAEQDRFVSVPARRAYQKID
jgi:bis(5'-nucleosyl)-tetraphosphatase (symmetrical)